jgi:hypothetical protein
MRRKIETKDCIIQFEDSEALRDLVFYKLIEWYTKHQLFSGESIMQSDRGIIESPVLLSDIADYVIKFDVQWKDDLDSF